MYGDNNKDYTSRLLVIICSTAIMVFVSLIPMMVRLYLIRSKKPQFDIDLHIVPKGLSAMTAMEVCKYSEYSSSTLRPFHTSVKMQAPSLRGDFSNESQERPPPYNENMKKSIDFATHINETDKTPNNSEMNINLHL